MELQGILRLARLLYSTYYSKNMYHFLNVKQYYELN